MPEEGWIPAKREKAAVRALMPWRRLLRTIATALAALSLLVACAREREADVTAYVVAYHWGFALFDRYGRELEKLEAPQGTTVALVAVNHHATSAIARLPQPVAGAIRAVNWSRRAHRDVEQGLVRDPLEYGTSLAHELAQAHGSHDDDDHGRRRSWMQHGRPPGFADHGLLVVGYNVHIDRLEAHADRPSRTVFQADKAGAFVFQCIVSCGFGHPHPRKIMVVNP